DDRVPCLRAFPDIAGMRNAKSILKRCVICRRLFPPAPTSVATQKTCSAACRKRRRNRMAQARRRRALEDFRADEREPQHACRKRRRESSCPRSGVSTPVSRARLSVEAADLSGLIDESVDKAVTVSRATLKRYLRAALTDFPLDRGQASLRTPAVTCLLV